MLDIDVLVRAVRMAWGSGTQADATEACNAATAPFDGVESAAYVTGREPGLTRAALLTGAVELPVPVALQRRGAFLINTAGRVGVVVGPGRVLQPAGRRYIITTTDAAAWVSGWWPAGVTQTQVTR